MCVPQRDAAAELQRRHQRTLPLLFTSNAMQPMPALQPIKCRSCTPRCHARRLLTAGTYQGHHKLALCTAHVAAHGETEFGREAAGVDAG